MWSHIADTTSACRESIYLNLSFDTFDHCYIPLQSTSFLSWRIYKAIVLRWFFVPFILHFHLSMSILNLLYRILPAALTYQTHTTCIRRSLGNWTFMLRSLAWAMTPNRKPRRLFNRPHNRKSWSKKQIAMKRYNTPSGNPSNVLARTRDMVVDKHLHRRSGHRRTF